MGGSGARPYRAAVAPCRGAQRDELLHICGRAVRILFPLTQDQRGGIGRVATTLARALPGALRPEDRLVLVGDLPEDLRGTWRETPAPPASGRRRLIREQVSLPRHAAAADLLHLADHRPVLASGTPFVITLHDMGFVDNPEWYPRGARLYKRALLRAAIVKRPRAIVTVSSWCMERFLAWAPSLSDETVLRVIPPGLRLPAAAPRAPGQRDDPYFLTVSAIEPRKNHLGLLNAFMEARRRGLRLRWKVVGRPLYLGEDVVRRLREASGVDVLGSVPEEQLEQLYAGASFVATPSHAEGFGYPPLEAMARGIPAVCSSGSALEETVGEAAIKVPADDVAGWAETLLRLQDDATLREHLARQGGGWAKRYSPEASARAHVELFHSLSL